MALLWIDANQDSKRGSGEQMRIFYAFLSMAFVGTVALPAIAADAFIVTTSPTVSSNIGRGYTRVPRLKPVQAGTQVMANETGSGWIIYCGCDVEIAPGKVYTVEDRECKVESVNIRRAGLPHITKYPNGQRGEEEVTRCGVVPLWALPAGAGAAVGICALSGCFDEDDDGPVQASP